MKIVSPNNISDVFKLPFEDLVETFFSGLVATKLPEVIVDEEVEISLALSDVYLRINLDNPDQNIASVSVETENKLERAFSDFAELLLGIPACKKTSTEPFIDYFHRRLNVALSVMRDGDSCNLPVINDYQVLGKDSHGFNTYLLRLSPAKFLDAYKANLSDFVLLTDRMYEKMLGKADISTPGIPARKQLEFLRKYLENRTETTGESRFSFNLSSVNFRRLMVQFDGPGGTGMMQTPFSDDASVKAALPFFLEAQGEVDIEDVKIITPLSAVNDVDLQFSIRRPSVRNRFSATYCSLSPDQRARMSSYELEAYERIVLGLQRNLCFVKNKKLENDFVRLAHWLIRKVAYCLEEPDFAKKPAIKWMKTNGDAEYKKMEDDFLLPLLFERLREEFGQVVTKKPEKFGGHVDILFGDIPVELKVRKGHKEALIDDVVDEKYRPTSQAATYAATTRLGCVVVLDLPTDSPQITNLASCVKLVTRNFVEADLATSVVVFILHCNLPRPSSAR